ncbi:MAG: ATP-binding protein, partial [Candidatus Hydrothermarchaeota archaeon]|nr:ATP-binding protein [Candidatus Hydrothermarchaeota archaeon]
MLRREKKMPTINPFKYAEVVTGEDFVDREDELKELISDLISGQNVILYSPRRYGKTSLIKEIFRRIGSKAITVYVDLYGVMSGEVLAQRMANQLMTSAYTTLDKLKKAIEEVLVGVSARIEIELGVVSVRLVWDREREHATLEEVFDLPQKIAEKQHKKMIVAFDEFQEITELDGTRTEKLLRSKIQHHKDVAYLFAGSKVSMMIEMFGSYERAFYKFGKIMPLRKISSEKLKNFIIDKFKATGKTIEETTVEKILTFVNGHPYFMQMLCNEMWLLSENKVLNEHFQKAVEIITARNADFYTQIFGDLAKHQKTLLVG